jgi:hypothetical protein
MIWFARMNESMAVVCLYQHGLVLLRGSTFGFVVVHPLWVTRTFRNDLVGGRAPLPVLSIYGTCDPARTIMSTVQCRHACYLPIYCCGEREIVHHMVVVRRFGTGLESFLSRAPSLPPSPPTRFQRCGV